MKSRRSANCGLSRSEALSLLAKEGCSASLVRHSVSVSAYARRIAGIILSKGHSIDVGFVETAALLHDIGRCRTNGIDHGIEGCRMLEKISPGFARVCEIHIGAGLDRNEAASLGLPPKDYLPQTLEEKVIAYADNHVSGDRVISSAESVEKFEKRLGKNHPALKRIKELNEYIEGLCENAKGS
ncbi:MAG: HDIG domain-containing protein [Candidatus Altiarchaeota archaeon]|nr:HDIG domain-containing protein [Candidatus Altiarchaeota archaeon]